MNAKNILWLMTLGALGLCSVVGCEDKRRHKASEYVEFGPVDLALAEDAQAEIVARAFLETAQDLQRVRVEGLGVDGNAERFDKDMARLMALADSAAIYKQVKPGNQKGSPFVPVDITESAAVRHVVSLWVSKIAHYSDGLSFETLKRGNETKQAGQTYSLVATNAREKALLKSITDAYEKKRTDDSPAEGSKAYWDAIRKETLAKGFNVPIEARITVVLNKRGDTWRVGDLIIGPVN